MAAVPGMPRTAETLVLLFDLDRRTGFGQFGLELVGFALRD